MRKANPIDFISWKLNSFAMQSVAHLYFLGHAGLAVQCEGTELLIDPWMWSSTLQQPLIRGLVPPAQTIDFFPSPARYQHSDFHPQIILISNFETRHAPFAEIEAWALQNPLCLALPELDLEQGRWMLAALKQEVYARMNFRFCLDGHVLHKGPFEIHAHFHPSPQHLIWEVSTEDFNILYIPNAPYSRAQDPALLDICYEKFAKKKPDFLFLECQGRISKKISQDRKIIQENLSMTPIQAARLAAHIQPRFVGVVGHFPLCYEKMQHDYFLPSQIVEDQFQWALNHLNPQIKTMSLRSAFRFSVTKMTNAQQVKINLAID
jgi:hypothetical protein